MNRFFIDKKIKKDEEIKVDGKNFHHCIVVLKHRADDNILIFDIEENEFFCKILEIKKTFMIVQVQYLRPMKNRNEPNITVYQSIPKGKSIEDIIEKSVELGVKEFIPVISGRTIKRSNEVKQRWLEIIKTATKQCGRTDIMKISEPVAYQDIFSLNNSALKIIFYENSVNRITKEFFKPAENVSIIIGPEGGFTKEEITLANNNGFIDLSLGSTILRSSTALILSIGITKLVCTS
ncbi:16S rRNA (uracil(1498)-N(3))-methyltransferase [bacterium]|jgi:16S rRNA (uracil1498-N3)-methyltransferase|nr:16S rRNA (uracil(1498)-N(3))-methyltransferase [bacterium]MBT3795689.1 16S rRNA (uracil(1498)-N(3))-methyltransferase [bacterium]MBT4634875.1 16S rRNA (uracil(1498)-N(3))-methyltransferase [bacterium]